MADPRDLDAATWQAWIDDVAGALGVDSALVDVTAIHDLTRAVAHDLARPMAPVSAFMVGFAMAQHGLTFAEASEKVVASIEPAQI